MQRTLAVPSYIQNAPDWTPGQTSRAKAYRSILFRRIGGKYCRERSSDLRDSYRMVLEHNVLDEEPRSVVVIGAGLSGLQAANRLSQHFPDIVVLEASSQISGRIRQVDLHW